MITKKPLNIMRGTERTMVQNDEPTKRRGRPASGKIVVSIRLDPDVVEKFKATGPGWQQRMNDVLKKARPQSIASESTSKPNAASS